MRFRKWPFSRLAVFGALRSTSTVVSGITSSARDRAARAWAGVPEPDADASTAIVAHGLLGNIAVIRGVARMLASEPELPRAERDKLIVILDSQIDLIQGVLGDLVHGLPSQALAALEELRYR